MRRFLLVFIMFAMVAGVFYSCKKYKDPAPTTDPRLTNPYCNDPDAVNYNWGFPGRPDNTICFYPSDLFVGRYYYRDSVYITSSGLFISADSFYLDIYRTSTTDKRKIGVRGDFCGPGSGFNLYLTADVSYTANVDTVIGDTLSAHRGQEFCHTYDTVTGSMTRDRVSDSLIHISFQVYSDTAVYTHVGQALKK